MHELQITVNELEKRMDTIEDESKSYALLIC